MYIKKPSILGHFFDRVRLQKHYEGCRGCNTFFQKLEVISFVTIMPSSICPICNRTGHLINKSSWMEGAKEFYFLNFDI